MPMYKAYIYSHISSFILGFDEMRFRPGTTQNIEYEPTQLMGDIYSPGYPQNFSTQADSTIVIKNIPNAGKTFVKIVYLPAYAGDEPCDSTVPFTVGNSTKESLFSGASCVFVRKEKTRRRILTTSDLVIKLPIIINTEIAFKLTYTGEWALLKHFIFTSCFQFHYPLNYKLPISLHVCSGLRCQLCTLF